jgi:hypothetical protein
VNSLFHKGADGNESPLNLPNLHSEEFCKFVESSGIKSPTVQANPYLLESSMYRDFAEEARACLNATGGSDFDVRIVFHGTRFDNVDYIMRDGLDPSLRKTQSDGQGEYFSGNPAMPWRFCRGGNVMLIFLVITTKTDLRARDIIVVKNRKRQLPIATLSFEGYDAAAWKRSHVFQNQVKQLWDDVVKKEKLAAETKTKEKIVRLLLVREYDAASEAYVKACDENGVPPQSWAREVAAYVRDHIRDDETVDIYFPGLPARPVRSRDLSILSVEKCEEEAKEAKRKYETVSKGR